MVFSIEDAKNYEILTFGELKSSKEIINILASNLDAVDENSLEKFFKPIDALEDQNKKLKELAMICRDKAYSHPEWSDLAGRVRMLYIRRNTPSKFEDAVKLMKPILSSDFYKFCIQHANRLESILQRELDWQFSIFATETLLRGYLARVKDENGISRLAETPQYLYIRISVYLWFHKGDNEETFRKIEQTYNDLSKGYISQASPTQFNAGMRRPQLASCFVKGTNVLTTNRGLVKIENVKIGDIVPTHNGNFKKVIQVHENELGDRNLIQLSTSKTPDIIITEDHKIWSNKYESPKFTSVENIQVGDFIGIPRRQPKLSKTFTVDFGKFMEGNYLTEEMENSFSVTNVISTFVNAITYTGDQIEKLLFGTKNVIFDSSLAFVMGVWFACGSVENSKVSITTRNFDVVCFWCEILKKKFNVDSKIQNIEQFHHAIVNEEFFSNFFKEVSTENFWSRIYEWGSEEIYHFVIGMASTSGSVGTDGHFSLCIVNSSFMKSLWGVLRSQGVDVSYENGKNEFYSESSIVISPGYINTFDLIGKIRFNDYSYLETPKLKQNSTTLNDQTFVQVMEKKIVDKVDNTVYTLGVEDDHSYCVEGLIVENCFLLSVDDNMESLSKSWHDTAIISMNNGGIGMCFDSIRHSEIGNHGWSRGTTPWLKIENEILGTVDQGGRRKGSGTMYTNDWHIDIFEFVDLKKPTGKEEVRARDLFYGIMISDLFMNRVEKDENWSLFCPAKTNSLEKLWGVNFENEYLKLEEKAKLGGMKSGYRQIRARDLWIHILLSQIQVGMPFIIYKDSSNRKSNQQNLGTIRLSNLCVHGDTFILTDRGQIPIANLENKVVNVWNGFEWSTTTIRKTNSGQDLLTVSLSNGVEINCTPEHDFYLENKTKVKAKNLKNGMRLLEGNLPPFLDDFNVEKFPDAYEKGVLCDDNDYFIPHLASTKDKIDWFIGYYNVHGKCSLHGHPQIESMNKKFLLEVKLLLQTILATDCEITTEQSEFEGETYYLTIYSGNFYIFTRHIDSHYKIEFDYLNFDLQPCGLSVLNVKDGPKNQDTYCFTEDKRHMGTFNGVVTGQCTEIIEYVDQDNIASCNLASIPLSKHVLKDQKGKPYFDFEGLGQVTRRAVQNLNQVIDYNYYPKDVPEIKYTNMRNRPLGIGVQDLAGCFAMMDLCWDSEEAAKLNEKIARVMYYHGIDESVKLAQKYGAYETFPGSPASKGLFQFDLWALEEMEKDINCYGGVLDMDEIMRQTEKLKPPCNEFDWEELRIKMKKYGLRNSLIFAQMPTASSAQILGNNESTEGYSQLLFSRTVLSGQFVICVDHLVRDLEKIGMWNTKMLKHLFANQGSIQNFEIDDLEGPVKFRMKYLKRKYKTAFEQSQKVFANLYLSRARYQCQSSSNNVFMKSPTLSSLNAYHFYMWKGGAKTGMYYLKQTARSDPLNFALDSVKVINRKREIKQGDEECTSCSS